jgi:hypothetical protein
MHAWVHRKSDGKHLVVVNATKDEETLGVIAGLPRLGDTHDSWEEAEKIARQWRAYGEGYSAESTVTQLLSSRKVDAKRAS